MARRLLILLLISLLLAPEDTHAQPLRSETFLRLNRYYVLYTRPVPPAVHPSGHMVVPLRVMTELLGMTATIHERGTRATVTRAGRTLRLVAHSRDARLDWKRFSLPLAPQPLMTGGDMLVPIRALIEAFGLAATWDISSRVLHLRGDDMAANIGIEMLEDGMRMVPLVDAEELLPRSVRVSKWSGPGPEQTVLDFSLQPRSGGLPSGEAGFLYVGGYPDAFTISPVYPSAEMGAGQFDVCDRLPDRFSCNVQVGLVDRSPVEWVLVRIMLRR